MCDTEKVAQQVCSAQSSRRPGNLTPLPSLLCLSQPSPLPLLEDGKDAGGLLSVGLRTDRPSPPR